MSWDKRDGGGGARGEQTSVNPWAKNDERMLPGSSQVSPNVGSEKGGAKGAPPPASLLKTKAPGGGHILLLLLRLRQCCGHLSLMKDVSSLF